MKKLIASLNLFLVLLLLVSCSPKVSLKKTPVSYTHLDVYKRQALVNDPVLLILEEPWFGFNEETKLHIQQYLVKLSKTRTIVISTNDSMFIETCPVKYHIEMCIRDRCWMQACTI